MNIQKWLISIIIVNYKTPKLTVECVESILQFTQWVSFEVIVVDNWSWPESRQYFDKHMPQDERFMLIYSSNNLGFGWGNNLGYANTKGEYLFFLNSDTLLYEDSVSLLYNHYRLLEQEMSLGLLWCRLYNDIAKTKLQIAWTRDVTLFKIIVASFPFLRNIFSQCYDDFITNIDRNINQIMWSVSGAAFMVSAHSRDTVWWFDERFFLYMEEFDLAMRYKKTWYKNYYTTVTSIIHLENQSPKMKWKKLLISLRSVFKFIIKYAF